MGGRLSAGSDVATVPSRRAGKAREVQVEEQLPGGASVFHHETVFPDADVGRRVDNQFIDEDMLSYQNQ